MPPQYYNYPKVGKYIHKFKQTIVERVLLLKSHEENHWENKTHTNVNNFSILLQIAAHKNFAKNNS